MVLSTFLNWKATFKTYLPYPSFSIYKLVIVYRIGPGMIYGHLWVPPPILFLLFRPKIFIFCGFSIFCLFAPKIETASEHLLELCCSAAGSILCCLFCIASMGNFTFSLKELFFISSPHHPLSCSSGCQPLTSAQTGISIGAQ